MRDFERHRQPCFLPTKTRKHTRQSVSPIPKNKLDAWQLAYRGAALLDAQSLDECIATLYQAVEVDPECNLAWTLLSDALEKAKKLNEAIEALSRAVATSKRAPADLIALSHRSMQLQQFDQARNLAYEAREVEPSLTILASLIIARADHGLGDWEHAIQVASEVLQADPDNLDALWLRFVCWYCIASVPDEVEDHRHYIRVKPDVERHSRLLFMLNYLAHTTPEQVYEESVRWSDLYAEPLAGEIQAHRNKPDPDRRLKIAYISPDLRTHAIMKLLPAVFEKHDPEAVEVYAYSVATKGDALTDYVRRTTQHFVDLPLDRRIIADRIRHDQIDILIDLAGHSMDTKGYLAFATKPAPVQVSWLGILSTTGLRTMDYFIGDGHMPCPETEHLFTETVYRLPRTVCCYRPPCDYPVGVPPCLKNGYITFGSFNDPRKITQDVVRVWSLLLHLHPDAKLLLKYENLEREIVQRRFRQWFSGFGIAHDRVLYEGKHRAPEYLMRYRAVDIALDPFPYNGGTTTLDSLWMGVPIVTLCGRLPVACSGASSLSAIGLPVATTVDEYVAIASELVRAMPTSPDIRRRIRQAMTDSPLSDEVVWYARWSRLIAKCGGAGVQKVRRQNTEVSCSGKYLLLLGC